MKRVFTIITLTLACVNPLFSQHESVVHKIEELTYKWEEANRLHEVHELEFLYAKKLSFYAVDKSLGACLSEKRKFFQKHPDYNINISSLYIDFYKNGVIKCDFIKKESWKGITRNSQRAYLLFKKIGKDYLIVGESDEYMDAQRGFTPLLGEKIDQSNDYNFIMIPLAVIIAGASFVWVRSRKKDPVVDSEHTWIVGGSTTVMNSPKQLSSQEKGYEFEKFVASHFDKGVFSAQWRNENQSPNGLMGETNIHPDLQLKYWEDNTLVQFAIECKWRKELFRTRDGIEWAKDYQVSRYRQFSNETHIPVLIAYGVGGTPSNPNELYLSTLSSWDESIIPTYRFNKSKLSGLDRNNFLDLVLNKVRSVHSFPRSKWA